MIKDLRKLAVIAAAFMLAALSGYLLAASSGQTVEAVTLSVLSPEMVFAAEADEGPGDDATEEDISETGGSEDQGKEVTISVSVGEHGSVNGHSSDYTETLAPGGTLSLAIQADTGYAISDILVNGVSLHATDQESVLGQSTAEEELEDLQDDLSIAVDFSEAAGSSDASAGPDEKAGEDGSGEDAEGQEDGQEEVQEDGDRDDEGEDLDEEDDEDAEESEEEWDGVDWDYDYDEELADADEDWEDEDDADWGEDDDDWDDEDADGTDEDADDDDEEEDDADRDDKSEVSQDKEFTGQESTSSQSEIGTSDKSQIGDPPGLKTESEDEDADTQDKTGSDAAIATGSGDTETVVTDSETKEKSVTNKVYSRSDSSPKTGDRLPVIVVLILLSSLTMLAMIFCRERLHKERKVRP